MVCCDNLGLYRTVRSSGLLLRLRTEQEEGMWAVQGEEDTRGASLQFLVASKVGVGEQPERELRGIVTDETDFGAM